MDTQTQDQSVPTQEARVEISRRDALTAAAKVGAAGAAVAAGLGTGLGRAPAVVRADSTITLRFMHWNTAFSTKPQWFKDILDGFTKLHPGVVVESNFVAFPQYLPTLTSMAAAKTLP